MGTRDDQDGELTTRAGLPFPEIEDRGGCVTVRFLPSRYVPPQKAVQNVTERQQRVLAFLAEHSGGVALREIVVALGAAEAPWTIREDLATLKTLGLVASSGYGRGARWTLG